MSDEFTNVIDEENVDDSPRILLIGAGISGFALALSIRHASRITQSPVEVHIYEAQSTLAPQPYGLTLWRWAIELLRELGLLTRLEKVSAPIVSFIANDDETRETLVHWKATDPVASTPDSGVGDVRLPPMMGVTKDNLLRLLVIAYAGVSFDDYPAQAPPNWFETEGWAAKIPNLHLSHTLDSFLISSSTGVVTARFTNESLQNGTMLVGCDGVNSKVRSLLCNDHFPPQPAGACVISGLVNTTNPELNRDVPTRLEDGRLIPDLLPHEVQRYVGSGVSRTVTGKGTAFGVTNIGEGVLAWNLVVSQAHPGAQLENFVKAAGLSLGSTGTLQPLSHNANVRRTAIRNENVSGKDLRTLALRLVQALDLPVPCHSIISNTDLATLRISDIYDTADEQPESYTSPNFHPGRVILIGDAAHPVAINAQGSVGASLALTDAGLLAKLIGKYLLPDQTGENDELNLDRISKDFDQARVATCNVIVNEARAEGGWGRVESGWVRSLVRLSLKYNPLAWRGPSFQQMLTRGRLSNEELGLIKLSLQ